MAEDPPTNSSHAAKFTKSTKKYRIKKAVDRLSALHDSLLHQILSLLDTKEVIRTCVLSKRWRFLWTDSSSLVLRDTGGDAVSFALSVGRILLLCDGVHLNKLSIQFMTYQPSFDASVTTWVQFAIKNRIKDFTLLLTNSNQDYYKLPQSFYSNSSLTDLTIGSCPIAPRRSIAWGFLKNLKIVYAGISQRLVQKILKGCPVLEILQLTDCGGYRHLKVRSPNLTTLVISGWMNYKNGCCLMISAPYLRVLSVSDEWPTRCFVVGDFPSLVKAKVDYKFTTSADVLKKIDSVRYPNLKQSLESFSSVKELELGPWCVEVLSRLEEKSLRLSSSTRSHLTLTVWRHRTSIGGILNILKSSPNLESLVIQGTNFEHHLICDNQLQDNSSDLALRALKTANISGFSEAGLSGEPLLTLVKLLLKSATNLEKMVIDATTVTSYSSATPCSVEFSKFKQKLFSFPRSSPKAIVVIH